jgi:hypothetical protein
MKEQVNVAEYATKFGINGITRLLRPVSTDHRPSFLSDYKKIKRLYAIWPGYNCSQILRQVTQTVIWSAGVDTGI